ncbi:retrovirus-related pol polyprotein from transposon TNT 1-94 [Tanacetum coccineum]
MKRISMFPSGTQINTNINYENHLDNPTKASSKDTSSNENIDQSKPSEPQDVTGMEFMMDVVMKLEMKLKEEDEDATALEVLPVDMEAQTKVELNKKAHISVILCLGNKVLREVTGETTATGFWSKLETLYMTKSLANKLYLKKKLYTFCMPAGRKISEHIDEFNKIVLDLANIEVKFENEDLALLLLTSLQASYEHVVDTLLYGREALTLEDVMATLNSKEIKERSKAKGGDGEGLYVRGRTDRRDSHQSRGKLRSKSRGGRLKCYICQSEDHLKRNCLKNNRKKSTGYVKKDDQPSSSGLTYDDSEVMVVMDSGCSYHMTPRYIPELKRNLISLGTLEKVGYTVKLQSGKIKVINGSRGLSAGFGIKKDRTFRERDLLSAGNAGAVWQEKSRFKHKAFEKFKECKQLVKNQTGRMVKKLRMDNGLEFYNREFEQLCNESGIARHLTVSGTPQQNGVAERMNKTLMDKSPSREIGKGTYGDVVGHPSDYGMLRIFSCVAYPHDKQGKLEPRVVKCVLLGYPEVICLLEEFRLGDETAEVKNLRLEEWEVRKIRKMAEPKTRTKPLRFRDESNMAAYTFVPQWKEDTMNIDHTMMAVACEDSGQSRQWYRRFDEYMLEQSSCVAVTPAAYIKGGLCTRSSTWKELGEAKKILATLAILSMPIGCDTWISDPRAKDD